MKDLGNINQYRFIKILYSLLVSTFIYILWVEVVTGYGVLMPKAVDFLVLLILVAGINYFQHKEKNKKIYIPILIIINSIMFYFIYDNNKFMYYSILGILFIVLNVIWDADNIYPEYYKRIGKTMIVVLGLSIVFYINIPKEYYSSLFRYYVMFMIVWIFLLRASRKFNYKIVNKDDNKVNVAILGILLVLSTNLIFKILDLMKIIFDKALDILAIILKPVFYVVAYIILFLKHYIGLFIRWLASLFKSPEKVQQATEEATKMTKFADSEGSLNVEVMAMIFKIILIIILALLIFMAIKRVVKKNKNNEEKNYEEVREKIESKASKKKKYKELKVGKTSREKVLFIYRKILIKLDKRDIFRDYMTPTQVYRLAKVKRNLNGSEIDEITTKYEEAKYSTHDIEEKTAEEVKAKYESIKSKL